MLLIFNSFDRAITLEECLVSVLICGLTLFFAIPMAIYGKKALKIEVEDVKHMDSVLLQKWIEQNDDSYVEKVLSEIGGYEQKWVKIGEDK